MKKYILILFFLLFSKYMVAQDTYLNPRTDMKLLRQFQDAKLGMFVHWMACFTPETGDSWGIGAPNKPKSVSDSITLAWNPYKFDAKKIVKTAKDLGCRYMVVISKHHDGFAIWPTIYTDFNINKIKFKKDILKELGEECKRQGLMYGIYYSIADIDYAGWKSMPGAYTQIPIPKKGIADFEQFNKNQVKELITKYNPDILWFDGFWLDPVVWNPKMGRDMYDFIKSIKPNTLSRGLSNTFNPKNPNDKTHKNESFVNDGSSGDFFTVEAKTLKAPNFPVEGCSSVSYPVYAYDPNAKLHTREELILFFDKMLCANGNFLLNIGPKEDGTLPEKLVNRFAEMSQWSKLNAKAVYKTKGGPYAQEDWGGSTYRNDKIYLHLRKKQQALILPAILNYKINAIKTLADGIKIQFKQLPNGNIEITIPKNIKWDTVTVLEMTLDRPYIFTNWIYTGNTNKFDAHQPISN